MFQRRRDAVSVHAECRLKLAKAVAAIDVRLGDGQRVDVGPRGFHRPGDRNRNRVTVTGCPASITVPGVLPKLDPPIDQRNVPRVSLTAR